MASWILNTIQIRILFKYSKTCYKSIQCFLQVLENFAKICFIQRSIRGQFHQHFKDYKYGTIVLCDSKIGKCSEQACFFLFQFQFLHKKEKRRKSSTLEIWIQVFIYVMNITNCYEFDFKLRFATKSNPKYYNSKYYKLLRFPNLMLRSPVVSNILSSSEVSLHVWSFLFISMLCRPSIPICNMKQETKEQVRSKT